MREYTESVYRALSAMALEGGPTATSYSDNRLTEILRTESALRIIRETLDDDQALSETAVRSYTHTNGFDKLTLLSGKEPEFKLRLHVWWPGGNSGKIGEFIHNHRWFFRSTTLTGTVHVETFTQRDGGDPMYRHEYMPRDDASQMYGLKVIGRSSLASDMMLTLTPGSTYTMGPDLLHRVIQAEEVATITLFVRWATIQPTASVFAHSPILDERILSVPSFKRDQLRRKLQDIIAVLDQRSPA